MRACSSLPSSTLASGFSAPWCFSVSSLSPLEALSLSELDGVEEVGRDTEGFRPAPELSFEEEGASRVSLGLALVSEVAGLECLERDGREVSADLDSATGVSSSSFSFFSVEGVFGGSVDVEFDSVGTSILT